jgi:hypothetical protein
MNKLELRQAIYLSMTGLLNGPTGVKSLKKVDASPADPDFTIEVVTDDPFNLADPDAVRRFRITVEEITDGGE